MSVILSKDKSRKLAKEKLLKMKISATIQTLALASLLALTPADMLAAKKGGTFTTGNKTFLLNGKPFIVKAAELHYPRIPRAYWEHVQSIRHEYRLPLRILEYPRTTGGQV